MIALLRFHLQSETESTFYGVASLVRETIILISPQNYDGPTFKVQFDGEKSSFIASQVEQRKKETQVKR